MPTRFEKAIELHKRHSRIYFSEVRENENELVVAVRQTRAPNGVYLDRKQLEEIARDLYALKTDFNKKLIVNAAPYSEAPSEIVTPEWIKEQMNARKFGLKGLVEATGVSKSDLSAMINGHKEMGIRTKGLFYYFFKSLDSVTAMATEATDKIKKLEEEIEDLKSQLQKKRMVFVKTSSTKGGRTNIYRERLIAKRNARTSKAAEPEPPKKVAKKAVSKRHTYKSNRVEK